MLLLALVLLAHSDALAGAAKTGRLETARTLLLLGADADTPDENGVCPLNYAAFGDRAEIAKLLLENGARVNQTIGGSTPLDFAVARGSVEAARILIDYGADVRRVYPDGRTPLHIAVANGHFTTVELLIDRGADLAIKDKTGMTPLDLAAAINHPGMVGMLLEAGATSSRPLLRNAVRQNRAELVVALLTHPGEPLAPVLREALAKSSPAIVGLLLKAGANINARDEAGFTPLHDAALAGNASVVRSLLERGADINAGDRDSGATALYMAATMGREDVVMLLLEKGADPRKGPSAVHAAVSGGFDKIAAAIQAAVRATPASK